VAKSENSIDQPPASRLEAPCFEIGKVLLLAGLRGHFTARTWEGIPALWQRLASYGKVPGQVGSVHYGLCFNMSDGIDYLAGVEVSGAAGLPGQFSSVSVPAQKYVVFSHREHVSKLYNTVDTIWREWFPGSGHEAAPPVAGAPNFFERYGEGFDPRTGMGDMEVWIPVIS
jgi:AraC family transcriptional regulator